MELAKKRKWPWLFVFLLLPLFFFPSIASFSFGKTLLIRLLEKRLQGTISMEALHLSWLGPQKFEKVSFRLPEVEGSLLLLESDVALWHLSDLGSSLSIEKGSFSFPSYGGGELQGVDLHFKNHELHATGSTPQGGALSLDGKFFSPEDFDLVADLEKIPTALLDSLFHAQGLLYNALGSPIDLKGTFVRQREEGTLSLDLAAPHAQSTLEAKVHENAFSLQQPFTATLQLTKEFSQSLLQGVNPLFVSGLESISPVVLRISPQGFSLPYRPFSLNALQIGQGMLDLGQVRIQNGKSLASLIRFLRAKRLSEKGTMNGWFSPLNFRIEKGLMEAGRVDILLADSVHICTWGAVDFAHNEVAMFLGLPAETLAASFGLKNLPRNYVLKIPIHGSLQEPELDTGPAAAKIGALLAAQQIPKKIGPFGALLDTLTQPKEDEDVPPPQRPFPWEK